MTDEDSCFTQAHNLNSTEKSILESIVECENTIEGSTIGPQNQLDDFNSAEDNIAERTENDTGLGESITNECQNGNDSKNLNKNIDILALENVESNKNNVEFTTENEVVRRNGKMILQVYFIL